MTAPRKPGLRQRGVAVITALLLTTLAVSIVASLFWQQQVQVRSIENQRLHLQIQWILRGTLDMTMFLLQEDARVNAGSTNLQAIWATPVANTRIDQYIDRERVQGEVFAASLSGKVLDANARYNLGNLANGGLPDPVQEGIFRRLLTNLNLDPALAARASAFVAQSQARAPVPNQATPKVTALQPLQLDDFRMVPGFTQETITRLREFAIVLPARTLVNVHTAPAQVIAAAIENMSLSQAQALVEQRNRAPWRDRAGFAAWQPLAGLDLTNVDIVSDYFLVQSWLQLDRASLNTEALVWRQTSQPGYPTSVVWIHQN